VALPDVEPGLGAEPGTTVPLTVVVVAAWAACLAVEPPEEEEGFAAAVAPDPLPVAAAGAAPDPADPGDPVDSEPVTAPAFGGLALQALSTTASTNSGMRTQAGLAATCVILVHPPGGVRLRRRRVGASARELLSSPG
jgi:hypothetical protein